MRAAGNFAVRTTQAMARRASAAAAQQMTFVTVPHGAQPFASQTVQKPVVPVLAAPVTTAAVFSPVPPKQVQGARDLATNTLNDGLAKLVREHRLFDFFDTVVDAARHERLTAAEFTELRDVMLAYAHLRQNDSLAYALNRIGATGFNLPWKNAGDAYQQVLESSGPMRNLLVKVREMQQGNSAHLRAAQELVDAHLARCLRGALVHCKGAMTLQEFDADVLPRLGSASCDTASLAAAVAPQGPAEADTALANVQAYASAVASLVGGHGTSLDELTQRAA